MAGWYDDAPSRRMAWDGDGSVVLYAQEEVSRSTFGHPTVALADLSAANKQKLNDEDSLDVWQYVKGAGEAGTTHVYVIFPEERELDGYFFNGRYEDPGATQYEYLRESADTTSGFDGTWNAYGSQIFETATALDWYRDHITSSALSNKRGVLFVMSSLSSAGGVDLVSMRYHLYGTISSGETPDRLLFLDTDAADAEFTLPVDFGDVGRGTLQQEEFKVKNNSATLQANSVQLTGEDFFGGSGGWPTFSDGGAFQATLNIGNIAATGEVTVDMDVDIGATATGPHTFRIKANVASWT